MTCHLSYLDYSNHCIQLVSHILTCKCSDGYERVPSSHVTGGGGGVTYCIVVLLYLVLRGSSEHQEPPVGSGWTAQSVSAVQRKGIVSSVVEDTL